ncbi:MAG: FtsX-like permease family protein [Eubacterium sp.]
MKVLKKDTLREIKKSISRFISIVAIITLGICFFSGVKSTSPSMKYTANKYFKSQKLMDIHLISTYGFQDSDVNELKKVEGVAEVMPTYSTDVIVEKGEARPVFKMLAAPPKDGLNQPLLMEGRMPQNDQECVIEMPDMTGSRAGKNTFTIGSTIKLSPEIGDKKLSETLKNDSFKIVGYIRVPQYVSIERGSSSIGNGSVNYYAMVNPSVFKMERYSDVFIYSKGSADGLKAYTSDYDQSVEVLKSTLEKVGHERLEVNHKEIVDKAMLELNKGKREYLDAEDTFKSEIAKAEAKLADGEVELKSGEEDLEAGRQRYDSMVAETTSLLNEKEKELANGEAKLADGQQQYNDGLSTYQAGQAAFDAQKPGAEAEIAKGEQGLNEALKGIEQLKQNIAMLEKMDPQNPQLPILREKLASTEKAYNEGKQKIDASKLQLAATEQQLIGAKAQLDQSQGILTASADQIRQGKAQLAEGWATFEEGKAQGRAELEAGQEKLDQGRKELEDGRAELEIQRADGERKLAEAKQKIADSEKEINEIDFGKWYIFNRDDNPGYISYGEDANRIDNVAAVFPVFFLMVAALVSFTTMTRMVEEERMEIGTLKALGYSNSAIAFKFVFYALSAALIGCILGATIGINTLPPMIAGAYSLLYRLPVLSIAVPWPAIIISCLVALSCTVGAALIICLMELREQPSELMRPKAPKIGKRIMLEKIPILWNHMSFISKVTARNIFRYKARFLMTVIGISGCTALILAGFGLQDSIFSIIPKQFDEISVYDGMMAFKNEGSSAEKENFKQILKNDPRITHSLLTRQLKMDVEKKGGNINKEAYLYVPETSEKLGDFVKLKHRKTPDEALKLNDDGAILTEKLAKDMDIKVGDTIRMYSDDKSFDIKVADITENYFENYVYIDSKAYEKATGAPAKYNLATFNLQDTGSEAENSFASEYLNNSDVVSTTFTGSIVRSSADSLSSLNIVVLVMLVAAGALAFVVLYNLTNINVSERVREIATIRVLGFSDREVNNYIFRENIILSIIGMILGLGLGVVLNNFIITTVETDIVMFGRGIDPDSFLWACVFTMAFTLIVNIFMTPVIKRVSMVESLKSVE